MLPSVDFLFIPPGTPALQMLMPPPEVGTALANATHIIQSALTPVFLLTAVGSLLGVFSTRLALVSDRIHALRDAGEKYQAEVRRLLLRSRILDFAVMFTALSGALTCCAVITLFIDNIRGAEKASLLFVIFGGSLVCTVLGLICFVTEVLIAGQFLRRRG